MDEQIQPGQLFGRLKVLEPTTGRPSRPIPPSWRCRCTVCGCPITVLEAKLLSGEVKTCGSPRSKVGRCWMRDVPAWYWAMISRATNPNHPSYERYMGRGIGICERWFLNPNGCVLDMGPRERGQTLNRINNDGSYSCGKCRDCREKGWSMNCEWATRQEQANNKSNTRVIELDGYVLPLTPVARAYGHCPQTVYNRLQLGWSPEAALTFATRRIIHEAVREIEYARRHSDNPRIQKYLQHRGIQPWEWMMDDPPPGRPPEVEWLIRAARKRKKETQSAQP